jgi:hypothetical protein
MPPKAVQPAQHTPSKEAGTSGPAGTQGDTSMAESSDQSVEWYRDMITQLADNQAALKQQLDQQGHRSIKMPSVARFEGEPHKLRGFLTQIKIKITNEGPGLPTAMEQVAYAGLFLSGRALEWFEPYLTEIQENGLTTTNQEARYMFSSWEGFCKRMTQMFGSPEEESIAEDKLETIRQTSSAMAYSTEFQMWATRTSWNQEALMAKYRRGLKSKVQDALILMEDAEDMRSLIDQAIKIDTRIYQRERASKGSNMTTPAHRAPRQVQKPWYGAEPMDLSGTREHRKKQPWKPKSQGLQGQQNQQSREQRPNQGSQQRKTFERTPQQDKWYKEGACMKCGRQGHFARDCKQGQRTDAAKGTSKPQSREEIKGTRECTIQSFAFCYNDHCPVHQDAKYGASYWPQEPKSDRLKGTEEEDLLWEIDQDPMATFNEVSAKAILQEYARAADYAEREASVAAYQGSENHQTLAYYAAEARKAAEKAQEDYENVPEASEADTETIKSDDSVTGIETPLDMTSIASQDDRESVHSEPSNQSGSATPSLDKGKKPVTQDFGSRMRAPSEKGKVPVTQSYPGRIRSIQSTVDTAGEISKDPEVKSHQLRDPERRMPYEDWEGFSERIKAWQANRGYPKFPGSEHPKYRPGAKKATSRPKVGTPRAKWLQELEQEEDMAILPRFEERHLKGCREAASRRYHMKDKPMTLAAVYQKWYKQRKNNDWESFDEWMDENITPEQPFNDRQTKHIKGALIMDPEDLEESEHLDWRKRWQITIPAKNYSEEWSRSRRFETTNEDEPRVDPKHPAHHTLSWIACVDDLCSMHMTPKKKSAKYPTRMHWSQNDREYRNAKYMHGWHATEERHTSMIVMQPGRFLTEECLMGREWWNCPNNHCPWHVEEKKRMHHWPGPIRSTSPEESGKVEAHRTRGSQW